MGDPFVRPGVDCEKYNDLMLRHPGTGHADTSAHEWMTQQHRDTLASLAGHYDRVLYLSIAENNSVARTRHALLDALADHHPCGPTPKRWRDALHNEDEMEAERDKQAAKNRIDHADMDEDDDASSLISSRQAGVFHPPAS